MLSSPENALAETAPVTLINVFEVLAEHVDEFFEQWRARAEIMSGMPGFLESRLYRAASTGTRFQLVNVARWKSESELEAAQADSRFQANLRALRGRQIPFTANPAVYRVAAVYD
jgi:heme-degrading monooxygenase HmoA